MADLHPELFIIDLEKSLACLTTGHVQCSDSIFTGMQFQRLRAHNLPVNSQTVNAVPIAQHNGVWCASKIIVVDDGSVTTRREDIFGSPVNDLKRSECSPIGRKADGSRADTFNRKNIKYSNIASTFTSLAANQVAFAMICDGDYIQGMLEDFEVIGPKTNNGHGKITRIHRRRLDHEGTGLTSATGVVCRPIPLTAMPLDGMDYMTGHVRWTNPYRESPKADCADMPSRYEYQDIESLLEFFGA